MAAVNCSVEESRIASRACGNLLPQDEFIRDNISSEDTLVISLGGNDIALRPSCCTILSILPLLLFSTTSCIENCGSGCACPFEDFCDGNCCCLGCDASIFGCMSNFMAWPFGLGHFIHLFGIRLENIISRLIAKKKPKRVIICMIYYPAEKSQDMGDSWADLPLSALGYNNDPRKLQCLIRKLFILATKRIQIPGVICEALPLFECLNPKDHKDYCQRVEPSPNGGEKMAKAILDIIFKDDSFISETNIVLR